MATQPAGLFLLQTVVAQTLFKADLGLSPEQCVINFGPYQPGYGSEVLQNVEFDPDQNTLSFYRVLGGGQTYKLYFVTDQTIATGTLNIQGDENTYGCHVIVQYFSE